MLVQFGNVNIAELTAIFLLCSGTFISFSDAQVENNANQNKIEKYFYNKCYTNSPNGAYFDNLQSHAVEFMKYAEYAFAKLPDYRHEFCTSDMPAMAVRVKQIAKDLKPCLTYSEYFLPDLFEQSFIEFLNFLCRNRQENIKNFYSDQGRLCRQAIETSNFSIDDCFSKIFAPSGSFVKKEEICDDFKTAKKCFIHELDTKCPNFRGFQILNDKFFEAISKPCAGAFFAGNKFLIIIAAIIVVLNKYLF